MRVWNEGIIVLDSNVLLELYLYPPDAVEEFFKVLRRVGARLWMPHQVGLEFHRNRETKSPEPRKVLDRLITDIEKVRESVDHLAWPEHHPVLDRQASAVPIAEVHDALMALADHVRQARNQTPDWEATRLSADSVLEQVTSLFEGKVGPR